MRVEETSSHTVFDLSEMRRKYTCDVAVIWLIKSEFKNA